MLHQVEAIGCEADKLALDRGHLLASISQCHQTETDNLRSTRLEALKGAHQQQFYHSRWSIWHTAHQIEAPSPPLTARLIPWRSRFRGHTAIDGGKGHKSARRARTRRCYSSHQSWNDSRRIVEWDGEARDRISPFSTLDHFIQSARTEPCLRCIRACF